MLQNGLLQETAEEWEQCERKMKDVRSWMEKTRTSLESQQNKKKPLRDQHALREKMLADIQIQKTKISLSIEKLQVNIFESTLAFVDDNIFLSFISVPASEATPRLQNPPKNF